MSLRLLALVALTTLASCSSDNGSPGPGTGPGDDAGPTADASTLTPDGATGASDSGGDAGRSTGDAAGNASGDDGGGSADGGSTIADGAALDSGNTVTLTVVNYHNYCNVMVDDGGVSNDSPLTASVTPGTVVTLVASPADAMFSMIADPWFGVDQNDGGAATGTIQGSGENETSTATVTVNANHCVSVCCDFPGEDTCPTTSQCP